MEISTALGLFEVGFGLHMLWQCDARQVLHVLLRRPARKESTGLTWLASDYLT